MTYFRDRVTDKQLVIFKEKIKYTNKPKLHDIKSIGLPQFSGISFISKIRMFLNPKSSAVLDQQIMKMKFTNSGKKTILENIFYSKNETQIRTSRHNSSVYEDWCKKLVDISNGYFNSEYRAADIERGFFILVRKGETEQAANILLNA